MTWREVVCDWIESALMMGIITLAACTLSTITAPSDPRALPIPQNPPIIANVNRAGTGILVDAQTILTASHVVRGKKLLYIQIEGQSFTAAVVVDVGVGPGREDIAVLRLAAPLPAELARRIAAYPLCAIPPRYGANVVAMRETSVVPAANLQITYGMAWTGSALYVPSPSAGISPVATLFHTAPVAPGFSGGPLIDVEHACIAGMNIAYSLDSAGTFEGAQAIPAEHLRAALRAAHVL